MQHRVTAGGTGSRCQPTRRTTPCHTAAARRLLCGWEVPQLRAAGALHPHALLDFLCPQTNHATASNKGRAKFFLFVKNKRKEEVRRKEEGRCCAVVHDTSQAFAPRRMS